MLQRLLHHCLIAGAVFVFSPSVNAGNISFTISLTGTKLTITHQGGSLAYYPVVLRMLPDGQWQALDTMSGALPPADIGPGASLDWVWPEKRPLESLPSFERIQPMMVRFFDQAGVSFGQISFFNQPPAATETVQASYVNGKLVVKPPASSSGIRSSWLLWPQEDGIDPIRKPIQFAHSQPAAMHIDWQSGARQVSVDTGAAGPIAKLLHETSTGYTLQSLAGGNLRGRQQRTAWLDAQQWFYGAAILAAFAAVLLVMLHITLARRKGVRA